MLRVAPQGFARPTRGLPTAVLSSEAVRQLAESRGPFQRGTEPGLTRGQLRFAYMGFAHTQHGNGAGNTPPRP